MTVLAIMSLNLSACIFIKCFSAGLCWVCQKPDHSASKRHSLENSETHKRGGREEKKCW